MASPAAPDPAGAAPVASLAARLAVAAVVSLFGKQKPLPAAMTKDDWIDRHELWPTERTILATLPVFYEFKRSPMIERVPGGIRVWLPPWTHWNAGLKRQLVDIVASRLGVDDPVASWRTKGAEPSVTIRARPKVPPTVLWREVTELIAATSDTRPLLGLGVGGRPVYLDLELDSPHLAISAGTGAGKSVLAATVLTQALHRGAVAVVIDVKRHSHRWCYGLPGVAYARDIRDCHDALVAVGEEARRRNVVSDDPSADVGPRMIVLVEELNSTITQLGWFWESTRAKGDPKTSPAIVALREVLFMGRAVRVNLIAIAQQLSARAIGGGESRENLGTRALARATDRSWAMLAPQITPIPPRSRIPGRWHVVTGDDVAEVQVAFATDQEARAYARAGVVSQSQPPAIQGPDREKRLGHVAPGATPVGLREALPLLPGLEMSLAAIRKARERDPRFPQPLGGVNGAAVYDLAELARWKAGRDAARSLPAVGGGGR